MDFIGELLNHLPKIYRSSPLGELHKLSLIPLLAVGAIRTTPKRFLETGKNIFLGACAVSAPTSRS
jgi:hypothetical protein